MNVIALTWARAQTSLSILEKSVLLLLASLADHEMFVEDQSQQAIAALAGCSRQAAKRALGNLARDGRIAIVGRMDENMRFAPCTYFLNCAEVEISSRLAAEKLRERYRDRRPAA